MYTAYDYKKQVWIEGEKARLLLIEQQAYTLELLHSDRGQAYADSIGKNRDFLINGTSNSIKTLEMGA